MNRPSNRVLLRILLALAFLGSCTGLLRPAARLADPLARVSVDKLQGSPFPVLIVERDRGVVEVLRDTSKAPVLRPGQSFLIPPDRRDALLRDIDQMRRPGAEGGWELNVRDLGPGKQHIELYWVNDGYIGGAYEATSDSIRPLYRKITGPGFASIFGGLALLLNVLGWGVALLLVRLVLAQRPEAPNPT